jgi:hypothetical protein
MGKPCRFLSINDLGTCQCVRRSGAKDATMVLPDGLGAASLLSFVVDSESESDSELTPTVPRPVPHALEQHAAAEQHFL